ncbi:MAG: hypothetical protein ACYC63_10375 [Armatimonadota bacterium]
MTRLRIACVLFALYLAGGSALMAQEAVTPPLRPYRVASDYPSIQAAVDSLPEMIGGTVYIPEGRWVLDKPLDLTRRNYHILLREQEQKAEGKSRSNSYVTLMGAGNGTILEGTMKSGPVIDMTDSSYCSISNLRIESQSAQCGILLARPLPKNRQGILLSCGWHTFYNVNVGGRYSVAAVYNQASEVNRWYGCQFGNSAPDAYCFVFTYRNFAGLVSPYAGELCEVGSNADQRLNGCLFMQYPEKSKTPDNPGGATIYIQGWAEDFTLTDCDFGVEGVKATVWMDGERNPCKQMHFTNNRFENKATHLFLVTGYTLHVNIENNSCEGAQRNFIFAPGRSEHWLVANNMFNNTVVPDTPTLRFGTLVDSRYERNWCLLNESAGKEGQTPELVVTSCEESNIIVPRREAFRGTLVRSRLTGLNEAGVRREYLGATGGDVLMNLTPVNTKTIAAPKKGDLALDDGTNTTSRKAGLAVFDGAQWQYMN